MNGRFDEKLAQLAFGELSPEEAARVEAQVASNPEAIKVLATYRSMKGGFRDLTDIPEDQMSKERLRNAILMQGLKPQVEKANPLGWLWMPATAFLLAAAIMMFNPRGGGEPVVAVGEKDLPSETVVLNTSSSFKVVQKKTTPKKTMVAVSDTPKRTVLRRSTRNGDEIAEVELKPFESTPHRWNDLQANNNPNSRIAPTPSVSNPEMDPQPETKGNATIVIIEDNRDESTGAYRATEVGTASNVLIGG